MLRINGLACGLILAAPWFAQAQVTTTTTEVTPAGTTEIRRVSQLIGSNVALQGNNNYGKIEDVIIDPNGSVSHLVVANGGRYVMLPWHAANVNYGRRVVNYNVTPQAVQPFYFARDAWPNTADPQYVTRMNQVFPGGNVVRREVLRPADGTLPPGSNVVKEKIKVKPNGDVKIKDKVR